MKFKNSIRRRKQKGIALFISMIFITVFSTLAIAMFRMSSNNVIVANNFHRANDTRVAAESGLEVVRFWVSKVVIPGMTPSSQRFSILQDSLQTNFGGDYSISNSTDLTTIGSAANPVVLDSGKSFYAQLTPGINGFNVRVTGLTGDLARTLYVSFTYGVRQDNVFDFGVATKGPLSLQGNILLDGVNIAVESDVYIESMDYSNALSIIGNSQIAGDVKIVNPDGSVTLQGGQAGIGGETGTAAVQNHVEVGAPETEFPFPNTSHFEQYATGITIDATTDTSTNATYENIRIAAGTNPHFSGDVQLNGVVFIETPNVVTFSGNVDITGIIIGDGNVNDNSGTNQINITGNVSSTSVAALPVDQYGTLTQETGTFMMAPGFSVSLGGNFGTLNGCIAANGVEFFGNAGGEIGGSILNYSGEPMVLSGNSDLFFNRSGITKVPAGFVPEIVVYYDPSSYEEIL